MTVEFDIAISKIRHTTSGSHPEPLAWLWQDLPPGECGQLGMGDISEYQARVRSKEEEYMCHSVGC